MRRASPTLIEVLRRWNCGRAACPIESPTDNYKNPFWRQTMTNLQLLNTLCAAACLAGALTACGRGGQVDDIETYAPLQGTGAVTRTAADLGYATLMGSAASLVDYSAFAVPANAANPGHTFQGTLTLNNLGTTGSFSEQGTSVARFYQDPGHLPAFSFQFVQTGTHIVPVTRGLIDTSHPNWSYILEPGR
eukprot:gene25815-32310_t